MYSLRRCSILEVMKNVKIRESLKVGWSLFIKRPWYLLGLILSVAVLFILTSSDALATALAYILYGGLIAVLLKHYHNEHIVFDDLFSIDQRWISFAFLGVIKTVAILLGLLCFIIPGIYLSIRWMFAELYVIDKGMRPIEALRASSALTEGHKWKLLLFMLTTTLLILLGLFFFIVGALVASLIAMFAVIKIYKDLQSEDVFMQGQ